jgi:hypothetical protein
MKSLPTAALTLAALALLATPAAAAGVAGPWRVTGQIADRPFVLDCRFEPRGEAFGGVCVEVSSGDSRGQAGKSHTVTNGVVTGGQARWSYPVSVMLAKVDVAFSGALDGDRIAGSVTAAGRKGAFTATHK